jgi:hypothetical protein
LTHAFYSSSNSVSTLVTLAGYEGEKPSFASLIKEEIKTLRKQLDKTVGYNYIQQKAAASEAAAQTSPSGPAPPHGGSRRENDIRALLDALSESAPLSGPPSRRLFGDYDYSRDQAPLPTEEDIKKNRNIHALLDALADHIETSDASSFRRYEANPVSYPGGRRYGPQDDLESGEGSYRALLDKLSDRERDMRLFDLQQYSRPSAPRRSMTHGRASQGYGITRGSSYGDGIGSWEGYRAKGPLSQIPKGPKNPADLA